MKRKHITSKEYEYTVVYEPVSEGGYKIVVPLLPGLITYGRNFEEAREMVQDAIKCHLEGLRKDRENIPTELGFLQEKITVAV